MDVLITFTLNGKPQSLTTDPERPLLEVLREDLHLTGAKYGCGEGECRACTVLLNGESVPSCLTPAGEVRGKSVQTIEGLAQGVSERERFPVRLLYARDDPGDRRGDAEESASERGRVPGRVAEAYLPLRWLPKVSGDRQPHCRREQ